MPGRHRFALCCALLSALSARADELVILVSTATEMPMARFERAVARMVRDGMVAAILARYK